MTEYNPKSIRVGTRKSQLAMVQTEFVCSELKKIYPNCEFPITPISTVGDKILDVALSKIGEKSLFTKELEVALANDEVDIVVHCLKDVPTTLPPGMVLGAIMEREDPRDAVVMSLKNKGKNLTDLPAGSVIGTSSIRRITQLRRQFPQLEFQDIRGNLNTRIAKLDAEDGPYSAIILAVAGLKRLGWSDRISQALTPDISLYAVGQGALAIECREGDEKILAALAPLSHRFTQYQCHGERAMLRTLEGGCSVPIGAASSISQGENNQITLTLKGLVASLDGAQVLTHESSVVVNSLEDADALGQQIANNLIGQGASTILNSIKH